MDGGVSPELCPTCSRECSLGINRWRKQRVGLRAGLPLESCCRAALGAIKHLYEVLPQIAMPET